MTVESNDARVFHLRESTRTEYVSLSVRVHIHTLIYNHTRSLVFLKMTYPVPVPYRVPVP
jgi:hypothetical protein